MKQLAIHKEALGTQLPRAFPTDYLSLSYKFSNVKPLPGNDPGRVHSGRQTLQAHFCRRIVDLLVADHFPLCVEKAEFVRCDRTGRELKLDESGSGVGGNCHFSGYCFPRRGRWVE